MNSVVLIGRLTKDVELKYIPNTETAVINFNLAVDRNYKNKNGERETDFIFIQMVGKIAENAAKYISKGSLVAIEGSIRVDNYKNEADEKRSFTKVIGRNIKFLNTKKEENKEQFIPPEGLGSFQPVYDDEEIPF